MDDISAFLGGTGNRVGGVLNSIGGGSSDILSSIADKLRNSFSLEGARSQGFPAEPPAPERSLPLEQSVADSIGSQVQPKAEGDSGKEKVTKDKMTIKKQLEDGTTVTVNVDIPNQPAQAETRTAFPAISTGGSIFEQLGVTPEELADPELTLQIARAVMDARIRKGSNQFQGGER